MNLNGVVMQRSLNGLLSWRIPWIWFIDAVVTKHTRVIEFRCCDGFGELLKRVDVVRLKPVLWAHPQNSEVQ